jgi:hypothetical protein
VPLLKARFNSPILPKSIDKDDRQANVLRSLWRLTSAASDAGQVRNVEERAVALRAWPAARIAECGCGAIGYGQPFVIFHAS